MTDKQVDELAAELEAKARQLREMKGCRIAAPDLGATSLARVCRELADRYGKCDVQINVRLRHNGTWDVEYQFWTGKEYLTSATLDGMLAQVHEAHVTKLPVTDLATALPELAEVF